MKLKEYLEQEWVLTLGCTEPASIAYAAATAAAQCGGTPGKVKLLVDPRIYKNCYAVGIPHSGHHTGIVWAAAVGARLPDPSLGLECFKATTPEVLEKAERLVKGGQIDVKVDASKDALFVDCAVESAAGKGRVVISGDHTNIVLVEKNGKAMVKRSAKGSSSKADVRRKIASLSLDELIEMARGTKADDRKRLDEGIAINRKIAEHGLTLFPKDFVKLAADEPLTKISRLVCAGVYARMWGEDFPVMSLAGSGNKGITVSVSLSLRGEQRGKERKAAQEALALACLVTSATTHHLGTLSAVCGCSNAAGIGLAAGLVLMEGGGSKEMSLAINNMVGNVTGMICDGAKIGCALKTMTAVDAAFRAASLAMSGIGIPATDGIVGGDAMESFKNMGRIAIRGMRSTDKEILAIMEEKLRR